MEYFDLIKGSTGAKNIEHEDTFGDLLRECRESAKKNVDEQAEVELCPRCGNELVTDEQGNLYCKECDWHPGEPEEVEESKKVNEQEPELGTERPEKSISKPEEEEADSNAPPEPPDEVKDPEKPMEMRKEYLGKSEETHYYFITTEGGEGIVDDFLITDQEGVKKYSAKDQNIEVTEENIADFLIRAIRDVQIALIERSPFMKYLFPKLIEKVPEDEEEEIIEEPEEEKEEKPLAPEEPVESKKITDDIKVDEVSQDFVKDVISAIYNKSGVDRNTIRRVLLGIVDAKNIKDVEKMTKVVTPKGMREENESKTNEDVSGWRKAAGKAELKKMAPKKDKKKVKENLIEMKVTDDEGNEFNVYLTDDDTSDTVIVINGEEFRFSPDFVSMWKDDEGVLSEEGLRELALDALANLEEDEFSELVAKGAEREVTDDEVEDVDDVKEPAPEIEDDSVEDEEEVPGEEKTTDDVDMSKGNIHKPLKYRPKKKTIVPEEVPPEEIEGIGAGDTSNPFEGKDSPGVRDGTGPAKGSAQRSVSDVGKRKEAGEKCPKENKEVAEAFEDMERELDVLDQMSVKELRDEVGEEADKLPEKDDLIDAAMHKKFGDKYTKYLKRQVGLEKKNNEGDNEMDEKKTKKSLRAEAEKLDAKANALRKEADALKGPDEGINPKPDDSEEKKKKKLAEEEELNETDVAKGAKALIQLAKDALKSAEYSKAAEYCAKLAEIEAVVPAEAEAEVDKKPKKEDVPENEDDEQVDIEVADEEDAVEEAKKNKDDKKAKAKKDKEEKAKKDKEAKVKKDKDDKKAKAKKDKEEKAKKSKKESKIQVESTEDISERKSMERLEDLLSL